VQGAGLFVGRRDVLTWLWQTLALRERIIILCGPALIGKSSLLLEAQKQAADEYLIVYTDLWAAMQSGPGALMGAVIGSVHQRMLAQADVGAAGVDAEAPAGVWKALRDIGPSKRLVFFFDHLDRVLASGEAAGWNFLDDLSDLMAQHPDVQVVCAVRAIDALRRIDRLPFARAPYRQLGPLSRTETMRLVKEASEGMLDFDYEALTRIDEWTGRLPYYVQLLCGQLFDQRADAGHVGVVDLEPALQALGQLPVPPFSQAWEHAAPEGKLILSLLGSLKGAGEVIAQTEVWAGLRAWGIKAEASDVREVLAELVAAGALQQPGATTYRFPVDLLRHWLRVQHPIQAALATHHWQPQNRRQPQPAETAATEAAPARRFSLTFLIPVAAVVIAVAMVMRPWQPPAPPTPTPTATPELATMAAMLLARTDTPSPIVTASPEPADGPSATPSPVPTPSATPTATATRPLVLARSMPAIAFMRQTGTKPWRIWLMGADGSAAVALTDSGADDTAPIWSPDGKRIAFVSKRDGNSEVYVMNADGSNPVNVTNHPSDDWTPAWSPDGTEIVFSSMRDGNWELYIAWANGSDPLRITNDPGADLAPVWSPDGRRILFASNRDGDYDLYVMDRSGKNLKQLTNAPGSDLSPAWSPDGRYIAFESMRAGRPQIFRIQADGSNPIDLTDTPGANNHWPAWSPDSSRIAFCSNRKNGQWDIYVMSLDGASVTQLMDDEENDQGPAWRP